MENGTIAVVEPCIARGIHQTWEKNGSVFYKFLLSLEDGTTGTFSSKKPESPWKAGDNITYEMNNGYISNIRKPEDKKSGAYFDDPKVQDNITRNLCLRISLGFLSRLGDQTKIRKGDLFRLAERFYFWCYMEGTESQSLLNRRSSLERALESTKINVEGVTDSKTLLQQAEDILMWLSSNKIEQKTMTPNEKFK